MARASRLLPHLPTEHLKLTDNEVLTAIHASADGSDEPLRTLARRIVVRGERFAQVYEPTPAELARNPDAGKQVAVALAERYGVEAVRHDRYGKPTSPFDFPVLRRDREVVSSTGASEVLTRVPTARFDYTFLDRRHLADAEAWLATSRDSLVNPPEIEDEDGEPTL